MTDIVVSELSIYPVKSCRGLKVNVTRVESFGLKNDRRWMVVDEKGTMLTQRKIAAMCLIQVELVDSGIILQQPTMDNLFVEAPESNKKVTVKVWADNCQAYDAGDEAANWLSHVLAVTCRLVYFPENEIRQVDLDYANKGDKTAFSDGFPLLLISQASLNDLNSRLTTTATMERFRPNLVISGCQPFEEDKWKKIRIGDISFRVVKPCSRCIIPNINIATAVREDEPFKTLKTYRRRENKVFFGQNVIADDFGKIEVGMVVEVIE